VEQEQGEELGRLEVTGSRVVLVWALLFVAALAVAIVPLAARVKKSARTQDRSGQAAVPQRAGDGDVAGFAGEVETAHGTRLSVRVARLHAAARQQQVDARALARRFGLGEGEPFVCEISARGEGGIAAEALRSIAIRDEGGTALTPFPVAAKSAITPTEPADPLATLLAPPVEALRPGFAVSVILWGRTPGKDALVSGLCDVDVALAPTQLASRDIDAALARIDGPGAPAAGAPK
jgi:hypothetical protein